MQIEPVGRPEPRRVEPAARLRPSRRARRRLDEEAETDLHDERERDEQEEPGDGPHVDLRA
jgi:hypothetical protein